MTLHVCSQCAARKATYGQTDLCAQCLRSAAVRLAGPDPDDLSSQQGFAGRSRQSPLAVTPRFEPGDHCGRHTIIRFIGRGGAGEVYEAEDRDTGRRLALKILHRRLRRPGDRERFLREGRSAAGIRHPNVVFTFEAAEIAGLPVLAMELLDGDTLSTYVHEHGPLSPDAAVDAAVEILDALEATSVAGLVHLDVKPSNCFYAASDVTRPSGGADIADRHVKVGDFGLAAAVSSTTSAGTAVSPAARPDGPSSGFGGFTPEFAAPEQILGGQLDARTDIYAVGATLFFLVTGRPPFMAPNLRDLLHTIATSDVSWPENVVVPTRLRQIVNRALSKQPSARFTTHSELRTALLPFSSLAAEPATLTAIVSALAIDALVALPLAGPLAAVAIATGWVSRSSELVLLMSACLALYAAASCGASGATIGMRRCRIACRTAHESRAWQQAAILIGVLLLPAASWVVLDSLLAHTQALSPLAPIAALASIVLFIAAPRRASEAVTRRRPRLSTPFVRVADARAAAPGINEPVLSATDGALTMGPFEIRGARAEAADGVLWDAWDPVLQRPVWIHQRLANTAPLVESAMRAGRATRLRWLQGCRSDRVAWDAYEAPDGAPLTARRSSTWPAVTGWLADLASELEARRLESDPARLEYERVWSTRSGRALLLDVPVAPASGAETAISADAATPAPSIIPGTSMTPQHWLSLVGRTALGDRDVPLPLSARACLDRLASNGYASLADAATALRALQATPDRVTTEARANTLMLSALALALSIALARASLDALPARAPAFLHALTPLPVVALICGAAAVLSALLTPGGLALSANRIIVVSAGGTPASPVRRAARALLAWSWLLVPALMHRAALPPQWIVFVPLALWHVATHPTESIVDRVLSTRLVPR